MKGRCILNKKRLAFYIEKYSWNKAMYKLPSIVTVCEEPSCFKLANDNSIESENDDIICYHIENEPFIIPADCLGINRKEKLDRILKKF